MPLPLIPFIAGAAAGALTTYLLTKRTAAEESGAGEKSVELTDEKLDQSPSSDEEQRKT